jgi:hypothetical protein
MARKQPSRAEFVFRHGVLGWGLGTGILWAVFMARSSGAPLEQYLVPALIGFPAGGAVLGLLLWRFSPQRTALAREAQPVASAPGSVGLELSSRLIHAYEPRWLTPDRLYAVYVTRTALHCFRVGGQLIAVAGAYPEEPAAYQDPQLVGRYAGLDPLDPSALRLDPKNLLVPAAEVRSAHLRRRRSLWTSRIPNSGSLRLELRTGGARKFILLGKQDPDAVRELLAEAGIEARVES